jgi:2-oxoisovalerate dehydrogenase E2 component (dihydrolipoyl transacylase)
MSLHTITMPDLGEGIAEVELVEWRVRPGDTVSEDQILCDVMTDKAAVEVPSPVAGRVAELGGEIGQMMAVGSVLIRIEVEADAATSTPDAPPPPAPEGALASTPGPALSLALAPVPAPAEEPMAAAPRVPVAARALASPAVRKRASAMRIDLAGLRGSGPDGRVLHADLDAMRAVGARGPAAADATREVRVIGLRRAIAQKMQESKRHIPHFTYVEEVDVTELEALRSRLNDERGATRGRLTVLPFLMRAIVVAVASFPRMNARYDDANGIVTRFEAVHIGIATQTPGGLMVPVVRHAEARDLWSTSAEVSRLADAARKGKAARDELSGSTITITSLGPLGGIVTTPIINAPEVAIIGVNRIVERPVIRAGAIVPRKLMNLSSSFDHRVIDGHDAALFVQALRGCLECPAMLFID